jgi:prepilin-type N-terminal cleavage/methylation domain-containing protein/prepilin-type processing-associated H-X9-DG protein
MKVIKKTSNRAFTLIELLVVIAIIALLLAIIVPSLAKAKMYAQRLMCGNNIRQQAVGITAYSVQFKGSVPTQWNDPANWLWDLSFWTTNQICQYAGVDYKTFFCPANSTRKATDARFWQFSWVVTRPGDWGVTLPVTHELSHKDESIPTAPDPLRSYRVLSQVYMFDKLDVNGKSRLPATLLSGEKSKWLTKLPDLKNAGTTIMIMDAVISDNNDWNFDDIRSGGSWPSFQSADTSNHFFKQPIDTIHPNKRPSGANIGYVDGHTKWNDFGSSITTSSAKHRLTFGEWFWW